MQLADGHQSPHSQAGKRSYLPDGILCVFKGHSALLFLIGHIYLNQDVLDQIAISQRAMQLFSKIHGIYALDQLWL